MINYHTGGCDAKSKVAIMMDEELLRRLDRLVAEGKFSSGSQAIQEAVEGKVESLERTRLARESAKLDPAFEQAVAEERLAEDLAEWPEY